MIEAELCEDFGKLADLRGEWNALLQRSATNVVFLTWEWQHAWWNAFGDGKDLRVLLLRGDSGNLRAIVPLFVQGSWVDQGSEWPDINVEYPQAVTGGKQQQTVHLVGGTEVSDYLDIIGPAELASEISAVFLDVLAGMEDWQALDLHNLPAGSPFVRSVAELARKHGWDAQQRTEDVCPVLELPDKWAEYLSQKLTKKQRHELRRKMRRAQRGARVEWQSIDDEHDLEDGLKTFFRLHKASAPEKDAFMDERMQGFFQTIARATLNREWLHLSVLRFDGQAVASYLCFDYGKDRLVYNSGFDLSTYSALSPGIVLLGYLVEDAIRRGYRHFDFLQGGERYKYSFGATDTEVLRLLIRR